MRSATVNRPPALAEPRGRPALPAMPCNMSRPPNTGGGKCRALEPHSPLPPRRPSGCVRCHRLVRLVAHARCYPPAFRLRPMPPACPVVAHARRYPPASRRNNAACRFVTNNDSRPPIPPECLRPGRLFARPYGTPHWVGDRGPSDSTDLDLKKAVESMHSKTRRR